MKGQAHVSEAGLYRFADNTAANLLSYSSDPTWSKQNSTLPL